MRKPSYSYSYSYSYSRKRHQAPVRESGGKGGKLTPFTAIILDQIESRLPFGTGMIGSNKTRPSQADHSDWSQAEFRQSRENTLGETLEATRETRFLLNDIGVVLCDL